jgi:hypothetical protein
VTLRLAPTRTEKMQDLMHGEEWDGNQDLSGWCEIFAADTQGGSAKNWTAFELIGTVDSWSRDTGEK